MKRRQRIGIYGGTFDPIHLGHVNLVIEIMEAHSLDEVWFCPAAVNPHKRDHTSASGEDRLHMLHIALARFPQFRIIDNELKRGGYSYAVDTLRELTKEHPDKDFFFIAGEDAAAEFRRWREPDEILKLAKILIGSRSCVSIPNKVDPALKEGITKTRVIEISSSEIRQRIRERRFTGHLLDQGVLDYILRRGLYTTSS